MELNLTEKERESDIWRKIEARLNGLLEDARNDNEKFSNSEVKTAAIRGRIRLIRQLLKEGGGQNKNPSAAQATENEYR
jgi:hypothetical protein